MEEEEEEEEQGFCVVSVLVSVLSGTDLVGVKGMYNDNVPG